MTDPFAAFQHAYRQAALAILAALAKAVQDTLSADDPRSAALTVELNLSRTLRSIVLELNARTPALLDAVLDAAAAEGERRALADT